jgi:hypothetical protein
MVIFAPRPLTRRRFSALEEDQTLLARGRAVWEDPMNYNPPATVTSRAKQEWEQVLCFATSYLHGIRDRWMQLMDNALGKASLPSKAEEVLRKFFNEIDTFMINQSHKEKRALTNQE